MKHLSLLVLLVSFEGYARTLSITPVAVEGPTAGDDAHIVLATDGRVYEVENSETEVIRTLEEASVTNTEVEVELGSFPNIRDRLDRRAEIVDVVNLTPQVPGEQEVLETPTIAAAEPVTPMTGYTVSTIRNMQEAGPLFDTMKGNTRRRGQCFNRAHVWTYEFSRRGLKAGKIWLFFTRKYIRQYEYKWWFHIAPFFKVAGQTEDVIFDREFDDEPQLQTDWKNDYIHSGRACPEVQQYSEYERHNNGSTEHCVIMKSSMYYWEPTQLEAVETNGTLRRSFDSGEVSAAYRNGFTRR